jgi:hypothetical protein
MNRRAVAGLNGIVVIVWIACIGLIGAYALHEDLTSDGLKRTQIYLVLGFFTYPLFYGAVLFALFKFASMFRRRIDYIALGDGSIMIGQRVVPIAEVRTIDATRNWMGLKQLVVRRTQGNDIRLAAYALSRRVEDVTADLRAGIPTQTPRSPDRPRGCRRPSPEPP